MTAPNFRLKGATRVDRRGVLHISSLLSEPAHVGEVVLVRIEGSPFEVRVVEVGDGSQAQGHPIVTLEILDSELNGIVWTERKSRRKAR